MPNRLFACCAVTAMIIAAPALASAQSVAYGVKSPVAITSFRINAAIAPAGNVEEPPELITSGITVTFVNTSAVWAAAVTFLIRDGQYTQIIVDKGTFSPGASIKHDFAAGSGVSAFSNATCDVAEIDFADGSTWRATPAVVAEHQHANLGG